ncbi:unnamed protein product, partial [Meganyctiphanes norvegica]
MSPTSTSLMTQCVSSDVPGGWSPWSQMASPCTKTCGGGTKTRVRSCTSPVPSDDANTSLKCTKEDSKLALDGMEWKQEECNVQGCWVADWTEWGNCSGVCHTGKMERYATCDNETCTGNQAQTEKQDCNSWNKTTCPSCQQRCPEYGVCKDKSTEENPSSHCVCTMGYTLSKDGKTCIRPPPTTPTPRPIPTLPEEQKTVATVISKTASTILIIFVSITLILFLILRIFSIDRVIQMNMEIALLSAHLFLMFPASTADNVALCRVVSIFIHLCFTACYVFIFLEALQMYSLVAYVVKKDGMFTRLQNTLVGWGLSSFIILFCMCFEYDNYGGKYHCWLQMDTPLVYGQFIPVIVLVIITFTLIEAAGAAEYKPLKGMDQKQLLSAKISQRTNLIILPLIFAHWMVGMMSEYEQDMALYGIFTLLSSIVGVVVFFFHCTNNEQVRTKLKGCWKSMCKSGGG